MNGQQTCEHGQIEAHSFLAQVRIGRIGNGIHYTTETMWCSGPVIATPKKCKIEKESGFCDPHESYECPHGLSGDHPDGVHCACACHSTPTPSEKPTCKHGETEGHEWIKYIPMHGPIKMRCPGPVIATPKVSSWSNEITPSAPLTEGEMRELIADEKKASDARLDPECPVIATKPPCDVDFCRRYRIDVNCINGVYCKCVCHGLATEPETPVTEDATRWPDPPRCAKCDHFMKEASCIVRRCPCDCDWIPASDSTPELRERIAKVLYAQDSDAGPVFYAQEYADGVDAVLVALGEPK